MTPDGRDGEDAYPEHVIPDGRAAEVDVEVCVAVLDAHQAVLLHARHLVLLLLGGYALRPAAVHPAQLSHQRWRLHQLRQSVYNREVGVTNRHSS